MRYVKEEEVKKDQRKYRIINLVLKTIEKRHRKRLKKHELSNKVCKRLRKQKKIKTMDNLTS